MAKNEKSTLPTSSKTEVVAPDQRTSRSAISGSYLTIKDDANRARGQTTVLTGKRTGQTILIGGAQFEPAKSGMRTVMHVGKPNSDRKTHTDLAALDAHEPEPDDEAPEFSAEQIAAGAEARTAKKLGRPRLSNAKQLVTLRLDPEILDHFRATGDGWQTRINDALLRIVKRAR